MCIHKTSFHPPLELNDTESWAEKQQCSPYPYRVKQKRDRET